MNESVKAKKASKNGWNGWNGDTINLVGVWVIASILLAFGVAMMASVVINDPSPITYIEGNLYETEWLNTSDKYIVDFCDSSHCETFILEQSHGAGYVYQNGPWKHFEVPVRFLVGLIFLLVGAYVMPKYRKK